MRIKLTTNIGHLETWVPDHLCNCEGKEHDVDDVLAAKLIKQGWAEATGPQDKFAKLRKEDGLKP